MVEERLKVSERPFIFHLLLQQKSQKKRMMKLIWANQRNQSRFGTVLLYFWKSKVTFFHLQFLLQESRMFHCNETELYLSVDAFYIFILFICWINNCILKSGAVGRCLIMLSLVLMISVPWRVRLGRKSGEGNIVPSMM